MTGMTQGDRAARLERIHEEYPEAEGTFADQAVNDCIFLLSELDRCVELGDQLHDANQGLHDLIDKLIARAEAAEAKAGNQEQRAEWAEHVQLANPWQVRAKAIEEAATIAESYEPHCESCPRGVAAAIRKLHDSAGNVEHIASLLAEFEALIRTKALDEAARECDRIANDQRLGRGPVRGPAPMGGFGIVPVGQEAHACAAAIRGLAR